MQLVSLLHADTPTAALNNWAFEIPLMCILNQVSTSQKRPDANAKCRQLVVAQLGVMWTTLPCHNQLDQGNSSCRAPRPQSMRLSGPASRAGGCVPCPPSAEALRLEAAGPRTALGSRYGHAAYPKRSP